MDSTLLIVIGGLLLCSIIYNYISTIRGKRIYDSDILHYEKEVARCKVKIVTLESTVRKLEGKLFVSTTNVATERTKNLKIQTDIAIERKEDNEKLRVIQMELKDSQFQNKRLKNECAELLNICNKKNVFIDVVEDNELELMSTPLTTKEIIEKYKLPNNNSLMVEALELYSFIRKRTRVRGLRAIRWYQEGE